MKVAIVGQFGLESFGLHIADALETMGHDVVARIPFRVENEKGKRTNISFLTKVNASLNDRLLFSDNRSRSRVMKRIMQALCQLKCDLIICTKDYFLDYEVDQIKHCTQGKIVMWYPDAMVNFGRSTFLSANYDALFFKDPYIIRHLRDIYNLPCYYLPECFNPKKHIRVDVENEADRKEYECEISLLGNLHSFRVSLLKQLTDFDMKVYGTNAPWWINTAEIKGMYTGRYLAYSDKAKAIHYSKINLNNLHIGEVEGVNVRTFEIAGMGGFQLTQWKPTINALFTDGKEIITYKGIDDLKEKVAFYIQHEDERLKIAEAAYMRACIEHTYERRLNRLIELTFSPVNTEEAIYDYHFLDAKPSEGRLSEN